MESTQKRKTRKRASSFGGKKNSGKKQKEAVKSLSRIESEETKKCDAIIQSIQSQKVKHSFSGISNASDLEAAKDQIGHLRLRLKEEQIRSRQTQQVHLELIKGLQQEKKELQIRFEAKIQELQDTFKQTTERFDNMLKDIKVDYQRQIAFLQNLLSQTNQTNDEATRSRYFVDFQRYQRNFANELITENLLYHLDEQMQDMDEFELRQIKLQASNQTFWDLYAKYKIPHFAAYGCRIIQQSSRGKPRQNFILETMRKYCKVYEKEGIFNLTEAAIYGAYRHAQKNQEIFKLETPSSIENAAKVVKTVAKVISGFTGVRYDIGRKNAQKDQVSFEDLIKSINQVKKKGYDIQGIDVYASRIFAFYLALLLVTGQRNRTIRELKFSDFTEKGDKFFVDIYASKTKQQAKYCIDEGIFRQVNEIQRSRKWMHDQIQKTEGLLQYKNISQSEQDYAKQLLSVLERRTTYVFQFFHGQAVHWHAERFKQYMIQNGVEHADNFSIHMIRGIALTEIAYDPESARVFAQHKFAATTKSHYVTDPFKRNIIKGLDMSEIIESPGTDSYVDRLMKREDQGEFIIEKYDEDENQYDSDEESEDY